MGVTGISGCLEMWGNKGKQLSEPGSLEKGPHRAATQIPKEGHYPSLRGHNKADYGSVGKTANWMQMNCHC